MIGNEEKVRAVSEYEYRNSVSEYEYRHLLEIETRYNLLVKLMLNSMCLDYGQNPYIPGGDITKWLEAFEPEAFTKKTKELWVIADA